MDHIVKIVSGPFALVSGGNCTWFWMLDGSDIQARANTAAGTIDQSDVRERGVEGYGVQLDEQGYMLGIYTSLEAAEREAARVRANLAGRVVRLAGDWLVDGVINNICKPARLRAWYERGQLFEIDDAGTGPMTIYGDTVDFAVTSDGQVRIGASGRVCFMPDNGELERIGARMIPQ